MIEKLSPAQQRLLAVALLGVVLFAVYLAAVRPYLDAFNGYREQIGTLEQRLNRFRAVAATRDAIAERLQQVRDDPALLASFLNEATPALASAELQQLVKQAIGDSGGRLLSTQARPGVNEGGIVAVTVKVAMRGDSETIHKLFYTLEGGQPLVMLDNVSVRALRQYRIANRGPAKEELDVRFDLTAYVRPSADEAGQ